MFCKNCGAMVDDRAAVCVRCGVATGGGIAINAGYVDPNAKSKLAAGLLQIFLGAFGVGRFYLGYTGIAVAQILVSICTCGFGTIWPLIDGILILSGSVPTDANGNPLRD